MSDPVGPIRSRRPVRRASAPFAAAALATVLLAGCGPSEDHTALAIDHPEWTAPPAGENGPWLRLDTECADVSEASIEPGAGFEGVPLVTVWGRPRIGRCREDLVVPVPPGTTRIEDAATGRVIDLPVP